MFKRLISKKSERVIAVLFFTFASIILAGCSKTADSSGNAALTALLGSGGGGPGTSTCADFPANFDAAGTNLTCTVTNLTYTCTGGGITASTTYPSVTAALLGVVDFPAVWSTVMPGFRGTNINLMGTDLTVTLDGSLRLVSESGVITINYSNYDSQGFPQTITTDFNGTVAYTYGAGGSIPTQIAITGDASYTYNYSNRIMTSYDMGGGLQTVTASGTVQMCQ